MSIYACIKIQVVPELEKFMDSVQTRVSSIYDMVDFLKNPDIQQKKVCYTVQLDYEKLGIQVYYVPKSLNNCFLYGTI